MRQQDLLCCARPWPSQIESTDPTHATPTSSFRPNHSGVPLLNNCDSA
jgi:hypothetical protein